MKKGYWVGMLILFFVILVLIFLDKFSIIPPDINFALIFILLVLFFVSLFYFFFSFPWRSKRVKWFKWEYGAPLYPVIFVSFVLPWLLPRGGMSNFIIDLFLVSVVTLVSPWFRVWIPGKTKRTQIISSLVALIIPLLFAVLIKLIIPVFTD